MHEAQELRRLVTHRHRSWHKRYPHRWSRSTSTRCSTLGDPAVRRRSQAMQPAARCSAGPPCAGPALGDRRGSAGCATGCWRSSSSLPRETVAGRAAHPGVEVRDAAHAVNGRIHGAGSTRLSTSPRSPHRAADLRHGRHRRCSPSSSACERIASGQTAVMNSSHSAARQVAPAPSAICMDLVPARAATSLTADVAAAGLVTSSGRGVADRTQASRACSLIATRSGSAGFCTCLDNRQRTSPRFVVE